MTPQRLWLLAHLLGVVAFFGTFVLALVSKGLADRSRNPVLIAHALATIDFADGRIMPAASTLLLVSGLALTSVLGLPVAGTGWVLWAAALFGVSGVLFVALVRPLQRRLERLARRATEGPFDWPSYRRQSNAWLLWACVSLAVNLAALTLMVLRPELPSF